MPKVCRVSKPLPSRLHCTSHANPHQGETVDHGLAKEALAGFAGAGVDYLAETKGEDFVDKEKAKHEAKKRAEQLYDQQYGDQPNYNPQDTNPPQQLEQNFGREHYKHRRDRDDF